MQGNDKTLKLLLISDESDKAALLRQLMEQQGLCGEIRRMGQGKSAVACARGSGPYKGEGIPDLVMLDFSAPDRRCFATLKQVAVGSGHAAAPVVVLTSADTEDALATDELEFDASRVFAPISLASFVRKMRLHSRGRFLRALAVMAGLGPILVRLPASLLQTDHTTPAMIA